VDRFAAVKILGWHAPRQREMVIARYWLEMSFREITDELGVTVNTATSRLTQALKRPAARWTKRRGRRGRRAGKPDRG